MSLSSTTLPPIIGPFEQRRQPTRQKYGHAFDTGVMRRHKQESYRSPTVAALRPCLEATYRRYGQSSGGLIEFMWLMFSHLKELTP